VVIEVVVIEVVVIEVVVIEVVIEEVCDVPLDVCGQIWRMRQDVLQPHIKIATTKTIMRIQTHRLSIFVMLRLVLRLAPDAEASLTLACIERGHEWSPRCQTNRIVTSAKRGNPVTPATQYAQLAPTNPSSIVPTPTLSIFATIPPHNVPWIPIITGTGTGTGTGSSHSVVP
jgi:hypothetical protein